MKTSKVSIYLLVYGITHALIDASCILLIFGGIDVKTELLTFILLYNILAFGLQVPFGWITDRIHIPVSAAILGSVIVALSLMFFRHPFTATMLAGIGNALFHVGGGTIALNLRPGKASMPGVFVAPGGIGLFFGGLIAKLNGFHPEIFIIFLLFMGLVILLLKCPPIFYDRNKSCALNYLVLTIVLLLVTICIRSAVGFSINLPWKAKMTLPFLLPIFIALGKGFGGFLSDYFGWIKITVGGLLVSAFLFFFASQFPLAGITGLFLFNMTMPVTLVAISNLLPGRPGFSFGLTTFALVAGALPTFFSYKNFLSETPVTFFLILLSSILLFIGLNLYKQNKN